MTLGVASAGLPVVFLPGWAFSGRVLELADHDPGWLSPEFPLDPATAMGELAAFLDVRGLAAAHLIGWSMGGYLALDFAAAYPDRVAALTLLGVRAAWPAGEIATLKCALREAPEAFLRDFHRKCFLGSREPYRRFVAMQEAERFANLDLSLLERGLDYLAGWRRPVSLPACPIYSRHGRRDLIAPLAERLRLSGEVFSPAPGGHTFFLDGPSYGDS